MSGVTKAQVRTIRAVQHKLGMDDTQYRVILDVNFSVKSTLDLTCAQASDLIALLFNRPARPPRRKAAPRVVGDTSGGTIINLKTPEQRRLITELVGEVAWREQNGYRRWLAASFQMDREPRTSEEASKVIQGLLAMRRRADDHAHA